MGVIFGTDGDNTLNGDQSGVENDTIYARGGSDSINGGGGDDLIIIEADPAGSDTIDGGAGEDSVLLETAFADMSVSYVGGQLVFLSTEDGTSETMVNVEQIGFTDQVVLVVGAGGYATIQDAVDAATGGELILVTESTTEQVVIDGKNNITIQGVGDVTITAPADVVQTGVSSTGRSVHAVITVLNADNVVVSGINVDGAGVGNTISGTNPNYYGVFYRNASGGLENVDVTGVREPYASGTTLSGNQRGVGVVVDNDNPGIGNSLLTFFMTGGTIDDFQKNATAFTFADLDVSGVTVTGGGAQSIIAQNGFQAINCTGMITGNTVTAIGYSGASNFTASAILTYSTTGLLITDNIITGSNAENPASKVVAIYVIGQFFGDVSGGEVSGNIISQVDNGVVVVGDIEPDAVLIENNSVTDLDPGADGAGVYFEPNPALTTAFDVDGTDQTDFLSGAAGADSLTALGGDDLVSGAGGNDTLEGGDGADTATYAGNRADYTVTAVTDGNGRITGFSSVTDNDAMDAGDDGSDTLSGIETLEFADVVIDVSGAVQVFDENGDFVASYATIQDAVDASQDGYTINVAAGDYSETVTVDVDVTIVGPNAGISGTGTRVGEAVVHGGFLMDAEGATLDGLTVDGGGVIFGQIHGVLANQDNVTVTNMIIRGDDINGSVGVVTPFNGNVTGLTVSNNLIADWGNGTYFNPLTAFTATGNTFDSNNVGLTGDQWLAGTFVDNNDFTNNNGHVGYGAYLQETVDVGDFFGTGNSYDGTDPLPIGIFALGSGTANGQTVTGTHEADLITAQYQSGPGNADTLSGAEGGDVLHGHTGDDALDGGDDVDTARYAGDVADYSITAVTDGNGNVTGFVSVTDNDSLADGDEGADSLTSVERLEFGDVTLEAAAAIQLFDENGDPVGVFATIQDAVDAAQDGYTVKVPAGDFDEDVNVHTGVTIIGAQDGVSGSDGGRDAGGGVGETNIVGRWVISSASDVTIDGLRFINDATTTGGGAGAPTLLVQTGGDASGHSITNSIFWSTVMGGANGVDDRAISTQVIGGGALSITDNLISGSQQGLFSTASWGRAIWFDGGGIALTADGNVISWARTGFNLDMTGPSTADVTDNDLTNSGSGVTVGVDDDGVNVSGNTIENLGTDFSFRNLTNDVTFDVADAVATLNPVGANDPIVVLGGSGNDSFTGSDNVDYLDGNNHPTLGATADADTLSGAGGDDFLLGRAGDDSLTGGNGADALDGGAGTDTANYAGAVGPNDIAMVADADPLTVGDQAGWQVTSTEGVDQLDDVEIVSHAFGNILLVGNGGFATIQEAIDASADGDTILIAEGNYTEQLTIDGRANLTIQAVGDVTIAAPADLAVNGVSDYYGDNVRAVIGVTDSTNIHISGLTVDGAYAGDTSTGDPNGDEFSGIAYLNSSGDVDDVVIRNVSNSEGGGLFGLQHGSGFFVDNTGLSSGNDVSFTNSSISDFQKTGALILGAVIDFTGNTITGVGPTGLTAQNGIQIALSEGSLDDNVISAIGYTVPTGGTYFYSSGIIAYEPSGPLGMDGNTITGVGGAGEFTALDLSDTEGVSVAFTNNFIAAVTNGIVAYTYTGGAVGLDANPDFSGNIFAAIDDLGIWFDPENAVLAPFQTLTDFAINGTAFRDSLAGSAGDDSFTGGASADALVGRFGDDTLAGDAGRDDLAGGLGMDLLMGGSEKDTLVGGAGADTLRGGLGRDLLKGNGDTDQFVFDSTGKAGSDRVFDFTSGADVIALDGAVFGLPAGPIDPGIFVVGNQAQDANDRLIYNDANGRLFYDADGSGAGAQVIISSFVGAPTIAASDIIVI